MYHHWESNSDSSDSESRISNTSILSPKPGVDSVDATGKNETNYVEDFRLQIHILAAEVEEMAKRRLETISNQREVCTYPIHLQA